MTVSSEASLRLPDFLGVGVVKAGTTWLHHMLREQPDIHVPPQKPVLYWDRHIDKPLKSYSAIFRTAGDRICGELTASYSVLPRETIERIRSLIPDLRVIILLREPRSRAWSEARMEYSVVRGKTLDDISDTRLQAFMESQKCLERGDYPDILNRWWDAFGREQVFVGLYDDITERPAELLEQVVRFLGAPSCATLPDAVLEERVFAGTPRPMPDASRRYLEATYDRAFVERVGDMIGVDLVERWGY